MKSSLERARDAFVREAWREAFTAFMAESERTTLSADDGERLAICAYLVGEDDACAGAWEAAHRVAWEAGDVAQSARYAFWLGFCLMLRGQMAQATGWLARAERIVGDHHADCAAAGYLLIPRALGALDEGDFDAACALSVKAIELGTRFGDTDLRAFGMLGNGEALIAMGETADGIARLDEVMVSVSMGEVGVIATGIVYCAVILECMRLFDLERAAEWTRVLTGWCDGQPDLVPYRGQCLVHRSQLEQADGAWAAAAATAEAACRRLSDPPHPALGLAHYQLAELARLVGSYDDAVEGYRQASRHGFEPMPGHALLQLARGDATGAADAVRRALGNADVPAGRPVLLAAAVEVFRNVGDLAAARAAADELQVIAQSSKARTLTAMAAQAHGACLLDEQDPQGALAPLHAAVAAWRALRMPYDRACAIRLLGSAFSALGDSDAARVEFEEADAAFDELGAVADVARLAEGNRSVTSPLSRREREVLAAVAAGRTNRQIADELCISPHTVRRHLENIFAKLGVSSRAAATAAAYEHGLL